MIYNIVVAGVGGQGTVLATRAIGRAALMANYEVRTSETVGMAQREGAVAGHVRFGHQLHGALIPDHSADILLGFELAEAARNLPKLKENGIAIISTDVVMPTAAYLGSLTYDQHGIREYLQNIKQKTYFLDAKEIAKRAGNYRAANAVMLGALAQSEGFPLSPELLLAGILAGLPAKVHNVNRLAFELGLQAMGGVSDVTTEA